MLTTLIFAVILVLHGYVCSIVHISVGHQIGFEGTVVGDVQPVGLLHISDTVQSTAGLFVPNNLLTHHIPHGSAEARGMEHVKTLHATRAARKTRCYHDIVHYFLIFVIMVIHCNYWLLVFVSSQLYFIRTIFQCFQILRAYIVQHWMDTHCHRLIVSSTRDSGSQNTSL